MSSQTSWSPPLHCDNLKVNENKLYLHLLIKNNNAQSCIWLVIYIYSKTCLKRNAIVPVIFSVFTGFRFTKGCVLIKQSTKNMIA